MLAGPTYPQRILTIADLGMSENSTSTVMHAMYSAETSPNPPVLFYIGDFCCEPLCASAGDAVSASREHELGLRSMLLWFSTTPGWRALSC